MAERARAPESAALIQGREVIARTAAALEALRERLDERFARAVDLLADCRGRVVVTGIGKSGHVARKIASTLSSTGTPAAFLHAAEGAHGDLGFIQKGDVCIVVSRSGLGREIHDWLPFLRERGCPLLALTGNLQSPLAKAADLVLDCGVAEEACPHNLAPTTSSTAALVMGDALAVALLRRRGLTPEDFLRVHPGGVLGRRLSLRVEDLMHSGEAMPRVSRETSLREALLVIVRGGLGMTVVVEGPDDRLWGVLADGDLKRILIDERHAGRNEERLLDWPVERFASRAPRCVAPGVLATDALTLMETNEPGPITSLVVSADDRALGVIHIHDILRAGLS